MNARGAVFINAFFGPGNLVFPDRDLAGPVGRRMQPYLEPLEIEGVDVPLVLPRRRTEDGPTEAYVICWDGRQATSMRAKLRAFVAHSFVDFDGHLSQLAPDDPVDAGVLQLVGTGTTYILVPPDKARERGLWQALRLMLHVLKSRPTREAPVPRPIGRALAEFHASLAAGNPTASAGLLDEIASTGGLSALNLAYLRVHRLSRLGRDRELLTLPDLSDVVVSGPPLSVRDSLLAAWGRQYLSDLPLADEPAVRAALQRIESAGEAVAFLVDRQAAQLGTGAREVAGLVALARPDVGAAKSLLNAHPDLPAGLRAALLVLLHGTEEQDTTDSSRPASDGQTGQSGGPITTTIPDAESAVGTSTAAGPVSWVDWARRLGNGVPESPTLADVWQRWAPPVSDDEQLAAALEEIGDAGAEIAWVMVGPFLEADELRRPAWRAAKSFLVLAAAYDRWTPADLSSIQALLEIFLRGAPPVTDYREVLDLIGSQVARWASVTNALPALDMVDILARSAASDPDARLRFALQTLNPLHQHRWRLPVELRWLAEQLSDELLMALAWSVDQKTGEEQAATIDLPLTILLYSLDEGVLRRTVAGVSNLAPQATIHTSAGKVGSDQLKAQARNAHVIALATRCAKHAATGFIRQHARHDTGIFEADGAGSASLLRAVAEGLKAWIRTRQ